MVKITKEDVLKLGTISNITINDDEIPALVNKLTAVLSYAAYLKDVASQVNVEELPHQVNVTRADEVIATDPETILANAPAREENFFVVPMILKS